MFRKFLIAAFAPALLAASPAFAEPLTWGFQATEIENCLGDSNVFAWNFDVFGTRNDKSLVWRSKGAYAISDSDFEALENQFRLQSPVSEFFDAIVGIRVDTPKGPNRAYGVLGIRGQAPQWIKVEADLFASNRPSFRVSADYEAQLASRLTLTPTIEINLPLADDRAIGAVAWGPTVEIGARLSYDIVDRALAPYLGVHYERMLGASGAYARDRGRDVDNASFVIGARVMI